MKTWVSVLTGAMMLLVLPTAALSQVPLPLSDILRLTLPSGQQIQAVSEETPGGADAPPAIGIAPPFPAPFLPGVRVDLLEPGGALSDIIYCCDANPIPDVVLISDPEGQLIIPPGLLTPPPPVAVASLVETGAFQDISQYFFAPADLALGWRLEVFSDLERVPEPGAVFTMGIVLIGVTTRVLHRRRSRSARASSRRQA